MGRGVVEQDESGAKGGLSMEKRAAVGPEVSVFWKRNHLLPRHDGKF